MEEEETPKRPTSIQKYSKTRRLLILAFTAFSMIHQSFCNIYMVGSFNYRCYIATSGSHHRAQHSPARTSDYENIYTDRNINPG